MNADRASFAIGLMAVMIAGLALWANYGQIDWRLVGVAAPIGLVVIGVGILALSRARH